MAKAAKTKPTSKKTSAKPSAGRVSPAASKKASASSKAKKPSSSKKIEKKAKATPKLSTVKKKPAPVKKAPEKKVEKKAIKTPVAKKAPVKAVAAKPTPVTKPVIKKETSVKATVKGKTTVAITAKKVVTNTPAPTPAPVESRPEKLDFSAGDFVVYPAHGVGYVEGVETQTIAGMEITLYTISFEKDRMRLKLPVSKVKASGLRKLSSKDRLKDALSTLQGRSQVRRIMWSRRAQEYEAKINSGDPVAIAEVLRDLKKADDQGEQSYSERQIYQAALERLAREVAAIEKIDEKKAAEKLEAVLGTAA